MEQKLTFQMQLRLSDQEIVALDAYCAAQRRETGENVSRNGVIREAIQRLLGEKVAP
jgi:cytochrome c553